MRIIGALDGRHKLAVIGAIICWGLSVWFSYLGFKIDSESIKFVGIFLAGIVTVVELVFNSQTGKLSMTLIVVGLFCYAYGIWTNITGFWSLQNPGVEFVFWSSKSVMPTLVGTIMEILPEPLLMWGLMSEIDGDFFGNLIGLWSGQLNYAQPKNDNTPRQYPVSIPRVQQSQPQRPAPRVQPKERRPEPTYHSLKHVPEPEIPDDLEESYNRFVN